MMSNINKKSITPFGKKQKKECVEGFKTHTRRMNFYGYNFLDICKRSVSLYSSSVEEKVLLDKRQKQGKLNGLDFLAKSLEIDENKRLQEIIAITFGVMFLEAVIWDYASVNISKSIVEDISKISLISKWRIIPKLVNYNKKINLDSISMNLLRKLVKERNAIVHCKSKSVPDEYDELIKEQYRKRDITISEVMDCVNGCVDSLKKIDTTDYWFFKKFGKA